MKLFGAIITVVIFGFVGLVATIFASLSRNAEFYSAYVPAVTVAIIVTIILAIYGRLKEKIPKVSMLIFAILAVLSVSAFEGYQAYLHSLEVVSSQDVDLSCQKLYSMTVYTETNVTVAKCVRHRHIRFLYVIANFNGI